MSRDKRYQALLNSKRWAETKRAVWLRAKGLCEECAKQGYVRAGRDCHHVIPISSSMSVAEMTRLCYDVNNVRLLCVEHHIAIHKEMHKGTKANRQERTAQRVSRFMDSVRGGSPSAAENPAPVDLLQSDSDSKISLPSLGLGEQHSGGVLFPKFDGNDPK